MPLDGSVWLVLGGGRRSESGRSDWVFLARGRFAPKAPLLSDGLSWISLDSLVRIETFQWVTRLEAGKLYSRAFSLAFAAPGREPVGRGHAEAQDCSWGKLNLISDFLQGIVVRVSVADDMSGLGSARSVR